MDAKPRRRLAPTRYVPNARVVMMDGSWGNRHGSDLSSMTRHPHQHTCRRASSLLIRSSGFTEVLGPAAPFHPSKRPRLIAGHLGHFGTTPRSSPRRWHRCSAITTWKTVVNVVGLCPPNKRSGLLVRAMQSALGQDAPGRPAQCGTHSRAGARQPWGGLGPRLLEAQGHIRVEGRGGVGAGRIHREVVWDGVRDTQRL